METKTIKKKCNVCQKQTQHEVKEVTDRKGITHIEYKCKEGNHTTSEVKK